MRFGFCTDLQNAGGVAQAGFAYVEAALSAVASMEDAAFREALAVCQGSGIACEALNVMLPGTFRLTGAQADLSPIREYLEKGFDRAALLGVKVQVFGSGGARNVPQGWPMEKALDQLAAFLWLAAPIAAERGISIAIEPLRPAECNIINTVSEALELLRLADLPNVGVLADWYHMASQGEGTGGMLAAGQRLLHCHIANPAGRLYPLPGDGADYSDFFAALKAIGYTGRVSVEGSGTPDQFAAALARLEACV